MAWHAWRSGLCSRRSGFGLVVLGLQLIMAFVADKVWLLGGIYAMLTLPWWSPMAVQAHRQSGVGHCRKHKFCSGTGLLTMAFVARYWSRSAMPNLSWGELVLALCTMNEVKSRRRARDGRSVAHTSFNLSFSKSCQPLALSWSARLYPL